MATVETRERPAPEAGSLYDGFISYSHAADGLLAPRLQAGLQRFAKPRWKRRALRIFRDESSLSANPHLWSSITDALDQSDWFVLLLSPDAAESEWVNQEVEYWLEHRDADKIIPVVTDGEFRWAKTDIDLESDAAPPALYGAFLDVPRWVDLRFARSEEQLDLNNPRFSAAVADIASAIRQVPKDELESEEVRQHRRTVRTAWAAGAGLLILALLAGAAALFAIDRQSEADEQRHVAEQRAAEADEQRQIAVDNEALAEQRRSEAEAATAEAEAAQQEAEQQRDVAQARELVLEAEKVVEQDPELSSHLALAAFASFSEAGEPTGTAESILRRAIANDRIRLRVPGSVFVAVHPDGSLMVTKNADDRLSVLLRDLETGAVVDELVRTDQADLSDESWGAVGAVFSPDGTSLAVHYELAVPPITIWNLETRESFHLGAQPGFITQGRVADTPVFSPDGELIAFETPTGVEVWSLADRKLVFAAGEPSGGVDFNGEGLMAYTFGERGIRVVDPASDEIVHTFLFDPTETPQWRWTQWSPDGTRIAYAVGRNNPAMVLIDVTTGTEVWRAGVDRVWRPEWVSDGAIFIGGESVPKVIDATTGEIVLELAGQTGGATEYDLVPSTELVASTTIVGPDIVTFDTSEAGSAEVAGWRAPLVQQIWFVSFAGDGDRVLVSDNSESEGSNVAVTANALDGRGVRAMDSSVHVLSSPRRDGTLMVGGGDGCCTGRSVIDVGSGEVIYAPPEGWNVFDVSPDGKMATIWFDSSSEDQDAWECQVVAIPDGATLSTLDCLPSLSPGLQFAPDGRQLWELRYGTEDLEGRVFDAASGELVASFGGGLYFVQTRAFVPDGSKLLGTGPGGPLHVFDVEKLLSGASFDDALIRTIDAHDQYVATVRISPDGTMAVTASWNEPLKLWEIESGQLLGEFGVELLEETSIFAGGFHPTLPWLVVSSPGGEVRIHTLDSDELVAIAQSRLSRPMTDGECEQYFRGPCPPS